MVAPSRCHVAVVKAVEIYADFLQKFKKDPDALARIGQRIGAVVPWHQRCRSAKRIGETIAHGVPVGGGKTQMVAHRFALHLFRGIVLLEGKGILRLRPFVGDDGDFWECRHGGIWVEQL